MTTDQRAALKRVRQVVDERSACEVYQAGFTEAMRQLQADESLLARAYLTEHPADDDEPVTLADLRRARFAAGRFLVDLFVEEFCAGKWAAVRTCGAFAVKTRGQLRYLLKGLGR